MRPRAMFRALLPTQDVFRCTAIKTDTVSCNVLHQPQNLTSHHLSAQKTLPAAKYTSMQL